MFKKIGVLTLVLFMFLLIGEVEGVQAEEIEAGRGVEELKSLHSKHKVLQRTRQISGLGFVIGGVSHINRIDESITFRSAVLRGGFVGLFTTLRIINLWEHRNLDYYPTDDETRAQEILKKREERQRVHILNYIDGGVPLLGLYVLAKQENISVGEKIGATSIVAYMGSVVLERYFERKAYNNAKESLDWQLGVLIDEVPRLALSYNF